MLENEEQPGEDNDGGNKEVSGVKDVPKFSRFPFINVG